MSPQTAAKCFAALIAILTPISAVAEPASSPRSADRANRVEAGPVTERSALPRPSRPLSRNGTTKKPQRGTGSMLRTIGALIFVVALIMIGSKFLRKHAPRLNGGIPDEAMQVLGKRAIGQKQVVHLVRLGSRILVIGGSPTGLQTLAEITDPIEVDFLSGMCQQDAPESQFTRGFLAMFRRQPIDDPSETPPPDEAAEPTASDRIRDGESRDEEFGSPPVEDELRRRLSVVEMTATEARHA